jgi:hypothetical protein
MSQTGTLVSCSPWTWSQYILNVWKIEYGYVLDAGGLGQYWFLTGMGGIPANPVISFTGETNPIMPFWASASGTITVSPNPPGTTNPVVLPCPPIIQRAAFGVSA